MKRFVHIKRFLQDATGLELSEYSVAAAVIVIGVVGVFSALGDTIGARIGVIAARIGG